MNIEANRLNTFANWPTSTPVDPIRIAKAGFFYTGQGSEVQCFSCSGKISEWNYGDQVMWRHRQLAPRCAFVVDPQTSGNVALILQTDNSYRSNSEYLRSRRDEESNPEEFGPNNYGVTAIDELYQSDALRLLSFSNWEDNSVSRESLVNAGFYHAGEGRLRCAWCGGELAPFRCFGTLGPPLEVHRMYFPRCNHAIVLEAAQRNDEPSPSTSPASSPPMILLPPPSIESSVPQSSGAAHNARILSAGGTWRALGVVGGSARHPNYASLASRLQTFSNWPPDRTQTPKTLADAGFFYTGTDDQVRCFYCDGGLGKWESGDAPWSEHARWFPHCGYVLLVKGQEFIHASRPRRDVTTAVSAESVLSARRQNPVAHFPATENQVDNVMESPPVLAALGAGLDAARVRRTVIRRLRTTGIPFSSSEGLIDAVLNDQLNEESWSAAPRRQAMFAERLLRDLESERMLGSRSDSPSPPASPSPERSRTPTNQHSTINRETSRNNSRDRTTRSNQFEPRESETTDNASERETGSNRCEQGERDRDSGSERDSKKLSLEEENRQLKEARLCKVCMDSEVSVVFLPCGHLVSCAGCGAALSACPLCRGGVRALVRAYLA